MLFEFIKKNQISVIILVFLIVCAVMLIVNREKFNTTLSGEPINNQTPKHFPKLNEQVGSFPPLAPPTVPEEIGLAMKYPQGTGVGMNVLDSNSFYPTKPGPLLTN